LITQVEFSLLKADTKKPLKMVLDESQFSQKHILNHFQNNSIYEPETFLAFEHILKAGDIFIDVGTHIGFFSLVASRMVGDSGKVLSFELNPTNYAHLLTHMNINEIRNILPHNWAVADKSGPTEFYNNTDNDGGHSLWDCGKHEFNVKSKQSPEVRPAYCVALDDYIKDASVRLIKIDTEGAEVSVISGMKQLLQRCKPVVIAEINDFGLSQMGTNQEEMRNIMSDLGYGCWVLGLPKPTKLNNGERFNSQDVYNVLFTTNPEDVIK
jgi:FkbM family methyltransferase